MVALSSSMLPLGSSLPSYELENSNPRFEKAKVDLSVDNQSKGYLVAFISNHCPFVINLADALAEVGNMAQKRGLQVVAIGCNDVVNYPADAPEYIPEFAEKYGFDFPYCFDETQDSAKIFQAECTPDFFLYDNEGKLFYRGQLDDSRPGNGIQATGNDLQQAVEKLLTGNAYPEMQKPSIGCSIKWHSQ